MQPLYFSFKPSQKEQIWQKELRVGKQKGERIVIMNNHDEILQYVRNQLSSDASHTIDHIMRVYNNASLIASKDKNVDFDVLYAAVFLHDIARVNEDHDNTGKIDHAILGAEIAEDFLRKIGYSEEKIRKIKHCIQSHRYRSGYKPKSKEAKILFDADKIDLLGALGIARSYMIAGEYHQQMYSFKPLKEYIQDNLIDGKPNGRIKDLSKHAPNLEFELKIKDIPNKLFNKEARIIAKRRIKFMNIFFIQLEKEMKGFA